MYRATGGIKVASATPSQNVCTSAAATTRFIRLPHVDVVNVQRTHNGSESRERECRTVIELGF